ncbi:Highly reducing polyketide synthase gloL [Fusarium oxysporum f. sp. rapae]|uniref:Highly reducing polyketide synthase gloL n=1 Tax=Fusarium oxysporum f. sp. rapae TaxID=485398 RepID=A0A8J5TUA6_FUSOX|nr:Highly reducing polyketide synthase gloL [Fusarium oxysporum f. sp. rapae]
MDQCDESQFLKHLAHSKPNLRVLEIGASTGGSTAQLLEQLAPAGKVYYSNYTFADILSGFFVGAKDRLEKFPNMEFATIDICKVLSKQGFDGHKYDLILATNVIHATNRFLLHELSSTSKWVNYVWGTLAGCWYGENDGRPDKPYISTQHWAQELQAAGFRTPDAAVLDSEEPNQLNAMIVARPAINELQERRVTLLTISGSDSNSVVALRKTLERRGYHIQRSVFSDTSVPDGQDVIAVLDDEESFFEDIDEGRFEAFKTLTTNLKDAGVFWITHLSQLHCSDPRYGQILGISRTLRSEMLLDFATCEVDDLCREDDALKPDYEYAVVDNTVYVGRIHPFSARANIDVLSQGEAIALRTSKPGRLDNLHWASYQAPVLKGDDAEINVQAAGLNFKDVLCAMGIVEGPNRFGLEGAGIVGRIGPNVKGLNTRDRVIFISHAAFSTQVVVSENLCEKIPDDLSFDDAATMPYGFATSYYSIFNVGNLKKGRVSSLQPKKLLAQMAGANIYATVSSEEKLQCLENTFGLDRSCIFNSRNDSFVKQLMQKIDGKGVDLALNSLSDELLYAAWKCIAPFGKMVEICKRDFIGSGKLDMSIFEDNRSYSCLDLDQLVPARSYGKRISLQNINHLYKSRDIYPIRPIKVYSSQDILDGFRYMKQGVHLGKIVASIGDASSSNLSVQPRKEPVRFVTSGSYLLVGGLGGLGRSISTWVVQRGARHLIYLSRSAGTHQKHLDLAQELASLGCRVDFIQGSITSLDGVTTAVTRANGHLKGVLQMSMVLCDQSFPNMAIDEWNTAVNPKAIYAGANTFLDAFSQCRASLGLPACAIEIGAVEEVGYMAEHQGIMQKLKAFGGSDGTVSERELLVALDLAMTRKSSNFCLGIRSNVSLTDSSNRSLWEKDIRMAVFHNNGNAAGTSGSATNDELKSFITKAKKDASVLSEADSAHFLVVEIGKKVRRFLLKPVEVLETSCSLSDLGMDSLVAIEMRQWWKTVFQFHISVLELMGMGTLDVLREHAAKSIL